MPIEITIDTREREVIRILNGMDVTFVEKNLDVGDFHIADTLNNSVICIERKSISDLAASIKDGRYAEQKQRLKAFVEESPGNKVVMVIEGRLSYDSSKPTKIHGLPPKAIVSSILNSQFRDLFNVITTENITETVHIIVEISKRIEKFLIPSSKESKYEPCVVKTIKRENCDRKMSFLMQLSAIPLISFKTAEAVAASTSATCMTELVDAIKNSWMPGRKIANINQSVIENLQEYLGVCPDPPTKSVSDFFTSREYSVPPHMDY